MAKKYLLLTNSRNLLKEQGIEEKYLPSKPTIHAKIFRKMFKEAFPTPKSSSGRTLPQISKDIVLQKKIKEGSEKIVNFLC